MKKLLKILSIATLVAPLAFGLTACQPTSSSSTSSIEVTTSEKQFIDYASELKFDENSGRKWAEATVKQTIDGDTTHFNVPTTVTADGVLKARYLGIDTPESTGKVQPWGKTASNFTKSKLTEKGTLIRIESNDGAWNVDSTGERHLVYIWYKSPSMTDYKCLNIELMQEGYSKGKGGGSTVYGEYFQKAQAQAMDFQLHVFSTEKDPDFYYGDYVETTIRGLKEAPKDYEGILVRFEGLITKINSNTAYVVDYDEENEIYYGMQVFYGYDPSVEPNMQVGNLVSFCGKYLYYEAGQIYQVSDLEYFAMRPNYSKNLRVLETGVTVTPVEITATQLSDTTPKEIYGGISYVDCILNSYVKMTNLRVTDVYTTQEGKSTGAMTLTCATSDNKVVSVRTTVLKDAQGNLITEDDVLNKTIDAVGIVGKYVSDYSGVSYQLNVYSLNDLTIK